MKILAVVIGLAGVAIAQTGNDIETQDEEVKIDKDRFKDKKIKDLLTPNNLEPDVSFRCGMFYSPKVVGAKPKAKIFILPKRFEITKATFDEFKDIEYTGKTCTDMEDGKPQSDIDRYCFKLFSGFVERQNMGSKSQVRDTTKYTMGDDFCDYLTKVGVPKDKVPPNKNFPNGIEVGFYYNKCNDKKWYDTTLRMTETVCCKVDGNDILRYNAFPQCI